MEPVVVFRTFNLAEAQLIRSRLEAAGLVSSQMTVSDNNRKARVYRLTAAGRKRLSVETADWRQFSLAIRRLLQGA